ncbi:MAG TPA: transporter [Pyrinomonadaceae bacterium]|jgi:hypothetical protein|nr:transporter [Pyrinomonadaceae bacterium]
MIRVNHLRGRLSRAVNLCLYAFVWLLIFPCAVYAQQLIGNIPTSDSLPSSSVALPLAQEEDEEEFIKPDRPSVANPAEVHKAGVLQLEYGYDGNFRAEDFRAQQSAPLTLRFAVSDRLLLQADLDTVRSETDELRVRRTGVGDARLGFQVVALKDTEQHPALAFAYYIKLPSASEEKNLGTGRVDHKIVALISKKLGQVDMDLNGAYLIVGRENESGWITGGQGALSFSGEFENGFGLQGELSGQTKDDVQPKGLFALGALTYKVNRRLIFDAGMRFGLNSDAPRYGVFAGVSIGVADLYKK